MENHCSGVPGTLGLKRLTRFDKVFVVVSLDTGMPPPPRPGLPGQALAGGRVGRPPQPPQAPGAPGPKNSGFPLVLMVFGDFMTFSHWFFSAFLNF